MWLAISRVYPMITAMMSALLLLGLHGRGVALRPRQGPRGMHGLRRGDVRESRSRSRGWSRVRAGWHGARLRGPCEVSTGSAIRRRRKPWRRPCCTTTAAWCVRRPRSRSPRCARALPSVHEAVARAAKCDSSLLTRCWAKKALKASASLVRMTARSAGPATRVEGDESLPLVPRSTPLPMDSAVEPLPPARMVVPGNPRRFRPSARVSALLCRPRLLVGIVASARSRRGARSGESFLARARRFPRPASQPGLDAVSGAKSEAGRSRSDLRRSYQLWSPRRLAACRPGRRPAARPRSR